MNVTLSSTNRSLHQIPVETHSRIIEGLPTNDALTLRACSRPMFQQVKHSSEYWQERLNDLSSQANSDLPQGNHHALYIKKTLTQALIRLKISKSHRYRKDLRLVKYIARGSKDLVLLSTFVPLGILAAGATGVCYAVASLISHRLREEIAISPIGAVSMLAYMASMKFDYHLEQSCLRLSKTWLEYDSEVLGLESLVDQ